MDRQTFELGVRRHLRSCREKAPIPSRDLLGPQEEAQCRILGGHLIHWLSDRGPHLLQERAVLSSLQKWDPKPVICFHSNLPGMVAAHEILQDEPGPVLWGLSGDFESLPTKDDSFTYHVELHSLFSPIPPAAVDPEVRHRYPLADSEAYFLHRDESVLGPLFARGAHHLWKWNGQELILLEEAVDAWVS